MTTTKRSEPAPTGVHLGGAPRQQQPGEGHDARQDQVAGVREIRSRPPIDPGEGERGGTACGLNGAVVWCDRDAHVPSLECPLWRLGGALADSLRCTDEPLRRNARKSPSRHGHKSIRCGGATHHGRGASLSHGFDKPRQHRDAECRSPATAVPERNRHGAARPPGHRQAAWPLRRHPASCCWACRWQLEGQRDCRASRGRDGRLYLGSRR